MGPSWELPECISVLTVVTRAGKLSFFGGPWAEWELTGQCPEAFKLSDVFRVLV